MEKKIYQIDAFTSVIFGGNPAAVVLDAGDLSEIQMKKIAKEMNLSETAFITRSQHDEYDYELRFFTPAEEVELCGHATIASFYLLAKIGYIKNSSPTVIVKQKTLAGILPVEINFSSDGNISKIMMTQRKPQKIFNVTDIDAISEIMGIGKENIGIKNYPKILPMAYSTGLPDIILPIKNIEALKEMKPNFEKLAQYSRDKDVVGVHAFVYNESGKNNIICRNFAPAYGINEEAATGTSNGALGAYLYENKAINIKENNELICKQGIFMDRPSKIYVNIEESNNDIVIKVGGRAVIVMEGNLFI